MKKSFSALIIIVTILLQLCSCGAAQGKTVVCENSIDKYYDTWQIRRNADFYAYPGKAPSTSKTHMMVFDDCEAFYRMIKKENIPEEDFQAFLDTCDHGEKIGVPNLKEIRAFVYQGNVVDMETTWLGCCNYFMAGNITYGNEEMNVRVYHFPSFFTFYIHTPEWETDSYMKEGVERIRYTEESEYFDSDNIYVRSLVEWNLIEGDYTYHIRERYVIERDPYEKETLAMHYCDIEIRYEGEYYYVYLGDGTELAPEITVDFVKSLTLHSVA